MSAAAVIPARGGSKRIPNKNIRDFCGRPLIARPIEAALASGAFDRVVVSTDSEEIAAVAKEAGAEVPFIRDLAISDDQTPIAPVLIDAVERLGGPEQVDLVALVYATAAMLRPADLARAVELLAGDKAIDAVLSVAEFPSAPQRALRRRDDGMLEFAEPEHELTRSQDLEPRYMDAGQFLIVRSAVLLGAGKAIPARTAPYELPGERAVDIDTEADWSRAEALFRASSR